MTIDDVARRFRILLVPGGGNSGPDHWHSHWEAEHPWMERVVQDDWSGGTREQWVGALGRHIAASGKPAILVAHSLACIVVCHWAAAHTGAVAGALLVAPADVDAAWAGEGSLYRAFAPVPMTRLPFPAVVVASTDDPYIALVRAGEMANAWGARLDILGPLGHIGSAAKLGAWPDGLRRLENLAAQIP